ncbi:MAG: hypothetical protein H6671_16510 [Anaerolineaceae bacterium]|nr:hypothetical protein [Anaerolineaceae bacterium]
MAHEINDLSGQQWVCAEFMYKPRPSGGRERRVFDFTLASRLAELSHCHNAAALFLCSDQGVADSLHDLRDAYPHLRMITLLVNPEPVSPDDPYAGTPFACEWPSPEQWRRYRLTDRWARILAALEAVSELVSPGYLVMPAHDAVWGRGLLAKLARFSERHTQNGQPAAVSPYTPYQHSAIPGVDIPPEIIQAVNAAFGRDSRLRWRFRSGRYQSFWGKTGLIPFSLCATVRRDAETMVWEDDLEIDRAIRAAGYATRTLYITNPALYRQALPVFDREGAKAVIERTLHYSLNLPGRFPGEKSQFHQPLDFVGRLRRRLIPGLAQAAALSETLIAECTSAAAARIEHYGASWVDWGAYRYVVRVGDPLVQVWKRG